MGQIRAPRVNWIRMAWETRWAIANIPAPAHNNYLAAFGVPDLPPATIDALESLQDKMAAHLAYSMSMQRGRLQPPKVHRWALTSRHDTTRQRRYLIETVGMVFSFADEHAFEAHASIGHTLHYRCITDEDKSDLPLLVASISMPRAFGKGEKRDVPFPRPTANRRSALRRETELAIQNHPGETAFQILNRLTGNGQVVESADGEHVRYWSAPGELKTITLDRFENVFSEANRAVAAVAAGTAHRRRR